MFTVGELGGIIERYALCTICDNTSILCWRDHLSAKYLSFEGIKTYHDFRIKCSLDGKPKIMFRERQYTGTYHTCSTKLKEITSDELPSSPEYYNNMHELSNDKVAHLSDMYNRYIPVNRRLPWLPPPITIQPLQIVGPPVSGTVTSETAKKHQSLLKKKKGRGKNYLSTHQYLWFLICSDCFVMTHWFSAISAFF